MTCLVKVVHPLGVPERGPGRCDNTSVGIVHPWGVYFEARASLFVCLKDKTCLRAEGGQGDDGACCSAAGAFVVLSRASGHRPWLPWLLCGAPFEGGRPEPMLRRSASRGSAPLYFVRSHLGVVTEGIFCPWSAVSSRATQASAFRPAWSLVSGTTINRGRGVSPSSPASQLFLPAFA